MPMYVYECPDEYCSSSEEERNVSISERDEQDCLVCGRALKRKISFTGVVYAPTAGGMK